MHSTTAGCECPEDPAHLPRREVEDPPTIVHLDVGAGGPGGEAWHEASAVANEVSRSRILCRHEELLRHTRAGLSYPALPSTGISSLHGEPAAISPSELERKPAFHVDCSRKVDIGSTLRKGPPMIGLRLGHYEIVRGFGCGHLAERRLVRLRLGRIGRFEILIEKFPERGPKTQVSSDPPALRSGRATDGALLYDRECSRGRRARNDGRSCRAHRDLEGEQATEAVLGALRERVRTRISASRRKAVASCSSGTQGALLSRLVGRVRYAIARCAKLVRRAAPEPRRGRSMIGRRLGPYEIAGEIGRGGMGEVFRARDAKLGREVAIKVLPEDLVRGAEETGSARPALRLRLRSECPS